MIDLFISLRIAALIGSNSRALLVAVDELEPSLFEFGLQQSTKALSTNNKVKYLDMLVLIKTIIKTQRYKITDHFNRLTIFNISI